MSALTCVTRWLTRGRWEQERREAEAQARAAQQRVAEVEERATAIEQLRRALAADRRQNHYAADIEAALRGDR